MKNYIRSIQLGIFCVFATTGVALAQQAPSDTTDIDCASSPADCPPPSPTPTVTDTTTTTTTTPQATITPAPTTQTTNVTYTEPYTETYPRHRDTLSTLGYSLSLGGGVDDFASTELRDTTSVGGSWNVRGSIGTKSYVGFEGSYIGSAQNINMPFDNGGDKPKLVGNGAQGALRLNATRHAMIQPFAYGGLAWRHYSVSNKDAAFNASNLSDSDDVLEYPVGVGVGGKMGAFTIDARGEYRWATGEDFMPVNRTTNDFNSMDRWGVMANVGVEM